MNDSIAQYRSTTRSNSGIRLDSVAYDVPVKKKVKSKLIKPVPAPAPQSKFPVQSGIPIPTRECSADMYPFAQMGLEDSFYVPVPKSEKTPEKFRARILAAGQQYRRNTETEFKLTSRKADGGFRFWRIK